MEPARYEIKMTCDEAYLPDMRAWVNLHPEVFVETYSPRRVNSLYFDAYDVECLRDNLTGISERGKLRFRWYGEDHAHVRGHLELKYKINQLRWKRLDAIPTTFDLRAISWDDLIRELREQAHGQYAIWLSFYNQPTLIVSYVREYYESIDHRLRVTLDHDLAFYEQILHPSPNLTLLAPFSNRIVLEVKADVATHQRVSNMLSTCPLPVVRNSKYVNGVLDALCFW